MILLSSLKNRFDFSEKLCWFVDLTHFRFSFFSSSRVGFIKGTIPAAVNFSSYIKASTGNKNSNSITSVCSRRTICMCSGKFYGGIKFVRNIFFGAWMTTCIVPQPPGPTYLPLTRHDSRSLLNHVWNRRKDMCGSTSPKEKAIPTIFPAIRPKSGSFTGGEFTSSRRFQQLFRALAFTVSCSRRFFFF